MKVSPTPDYTVRVLRQEWEELPEAASHYAGIFAVTLNQHVDIVFVPDVVAVAPPWDDRDLPADFDQIDTAAQARVATALLSSYVVTPNASRSGQVEGFTWPSDEPGRPHVVFYVTGAEFDSYVPDLERLTTVAGGLHSQRRVSELREHPVIGFLERRVVASPRLDPRHAVLLGQDHQDHVEAGQPDRAGDGRRAG